MLSDIVKCFEWPPVGKRCKNVYYHCLYTRWANVFVLKTLTLTGDVRNHRALVATGTIGEVKLKSSGSEKRLCEDIEEKSQKAESSVL